MMARPYLLRKVLLALFAGLAILGPQIATPAPLKPYILFLMPNQMRGDCL